MEARIAVCVTTTPNRKQLFARTFLKLVENSPKHIAYKVYSDDNYEGIATAKNKCLAMCEGYDYVALLDDDIFPLNPDWIYKYINSGLNHAMYIFDRQPISTPGPSARGPANYAEYALPRGCMLFFTRRCIDTAGGFDERFAKWGFDHPELSRRIYNMGLTPAPYIDIPDSDGLFYSHDEHNTCQSSVSDAVRIEGIRNNKPLFEQTLLSNTFIPYK